MCFKLLLESTAKYSGERIPGKGQETYTKHYRQGLICPEPVMLGMKPDEVTVQDVFVPSRPGKPKSPRVWKKFPVLPQWAGVLQMIAVDDIFTAEVVKRHLELGGMITGIGVWRPENSGLWGKFTVTAFHETNGEGR
jgi:hypothetical protein